MPMELDDVNILIVEDNENMRDLLRDILASFGARRITSAGDGAHALRRLENFPADLAVVDWMMEPVDGIEFTRTIRTSPDSPNPYLPIIMLTGFTEKCRVIEARDAGVTDLLAKPVTPIRLYERIRGLVEVPRKFIRTDIYNGPCRRRQDRPLKHPDRRVSNAGEVTPPDEAADQ